MANLNKTEKLIQKAAKKKTAFETMIFEELFNYYNYNDFLHGKNDISNITYLYCNTHRGKTFDNIARNLSISLSTLEDRRKEYQKLFLHIREILQEKIKPAA